MENVKIQSEFKNSFQGKKIDLVRKDFNKRNESELLPQSRKPKSISIAHAKLVETRGENYEIEPYENYLGK